MDIPLLPTINASLNGAAGVLLFFGHGAVKRGDVKTHRKLMISAFICSIVFLVSYVTYHALKKGVVTHYQGEGLRRIIYFFILGTHTPLAMLIAPFSIAAVIFALKGNFTAHVKITRWLYPTWMYVSVTGVLIYLILYILPAK